MDGLNPIELKAFLDEKEAQYNSPAFIESDPIQVPRQFSDPADIEIAGFLTATLAWGRKASIIQSSRKLISLMAGSPHAFLMEAGEDDWSRFLPFVHRTFNGMDAVYFMKALRQLYRGHGGLGQVFQNAYSRHGDLEGALIDFRKAFFSLGDPGRTGKHLSDVARNSSAKRLNMYLRWMVRRDHRGVDFGLWTGIPMSALYIPLDVHTGAVARKLGMLERKQDDWKAVVELSERLREFDPIDPIRYDFALFGLGSFEGFPGN